MSVCYNTCNHLRIEMDPEMGIETTECCNNKTEDYFFSLYGASEDDLYNAEFQRIMLGLLMC